MHGLLTKVMGILGALGKMNWTSSNLLRRRQFSARKILHSISIYASKKEAKRVPASPTITETMGNNDSSCVALQGRNDQRLSHDDSGTVCAVWSGLVRGRWGISSGEMMDFRYCGTEAASSR
jgi:hypothetical protein